MPIINGTSDGSDNGPPGHKSIRIHIKGRVQGVFFRDWTVAQARERGLSGWVRNLTDGSVEALISGKSGHVDDMFNACKRGPEMAHVTAITYHVDPPPTREGFHKLTTV